MRGTLLVGGTAVAAAGVALRSWVEGFRYGANSPAFVLSCAAAAVGTALAAERLTRRGERQVGAWLRAVSVSLALYLAAAAFASEYAGVHGRTDAVAYAAVVAEASGYLFPVALLQASFVAAGHRLGVVRPRGRRAAALYLAYTAGFVGFAVLALPVGDPYGDIRPVLDVGAAASWGGTAGIPWMLGVFLGPAVLWRAVPRARGAARRRTLMVAVVSLAPVATIVFCVLAGFMAFRFDLVSVGTGTAVLAVMYSVPFALCALGFREAFGVGVPVRVERWTRMLTALVGVPFVIVVVAVSAIIGSRLGAVLPVVLATVLVAAGLAPLRRRSVRALALRSDPVRARTAALVREAGADTHPAARVQDVVRSALEEAGLRVLFRLPEERGWVTADGEPASADGVELGSSARVVGVDDAADLGSCLPEVAALIERAVLEMAVRDQSARVAEAVAGERKRVERDLHDGVQGRLLALALDLKMACRDVDAPSQLVLSDAAESLAAAIEELRALASGAAPDLLARKGLGAALADLTARAPARIHLQIPAERLPAPVEAVAYLVACEAVTNALKHADAEEITVALALDGPRATLTVRDDGIGGADLRAGTGLRGLAERVRTAGGSLVVSDARPKGTLLEATLPCGW
ncbi:histidine kinase (plasmid) [Streptomycetaceae bacterium NBC_01309]